MAIVRDEKRQHIRRRVYFGEGVKITVKDIHEVNSFMGEATDISPWGVSFIIHDQKLSVYPKIGEIVIIFYANRDRFLGSIKARIVDLVRMNRRGAEVIRYGFEFINEHILSGLGKTENKNFTLDELFRPSAWCNDPFFFQEKMVFKVTSFQASGMKLLTSARNKSFLPNLLLNLKIYLPIHMEFDLMVRVLSTETPSEEQQKNRYVVNVEFINPSQQFLQAMVEYVLFCGVDVSPLELRREKLPLSAIEKSLSFYYATLQQDLDIIMHLRATCLFDELGVINSEGFVVQDEELVENYSFGFDTYDENSRQIICKMGKKPIACVRVIFNNKDRNKCEMASNVEVIPESLWTKRFVEISRLAWEKEYRESDVFVNLIRHIIRITVESGHSHILTSSPPALKQLYLKVGFQPLELTWKAEVDEKKKKESPMLLDAKNILKGDLIIDKFVWNKIYAPVARHLGYIK